ncbi:hypothetical protein STEG23_001326, partial [Scotinomys teguina]
KCSYHSSSKKPFSTANGDHHRKPQLDTMQRSVDCGEPSLSGYICVTAPAFMTQGTLRKRGCKDVKSQNT